jgi:hypothetical protein
MPTATGQTLKSEHVEGQGEGRRDRAVITNETMVVPHETEKGAHGAHRLRHWPLEHDLHLLIVHGHPCL